MVAVEDVDERLDAGPRQLHPLDVGVLGQHRREAGAVLRMGPHQGGGLVQADDLAAPGAHGVIEPPDGGHGRDGDLRSALHEPRP